MSRCRKYNLLGAMDSNALTIGFPEVNKLIIIWSILNEITKSILKITNSYYAI